MSNVIGVSLLAYPPARAGSIAVDTTADVRHQAGVETATNGIVPVVNIVRPDTQGVSHNKFIDYNVNREGLILNNSNKKETYTELSGYIYGNQNLVSGETAKLILNEVTGRNKTELRGFTEVAGDRAGVVVANPNGIYINGAGFINTNRAVLATGRPRYVADELWGFGIEGGSIEIDGEGLNTTNVDKAELYARAVQLNAAINADALDVVAGTFNAGLNGDIVQHDTTEEKPGISIDSSVLGGIYANKIRLVGTERGVGVNLPIEISAQESMMLGADGKITLKKAVAADRIEIRSSCGGVASDIVYADKVSIDAAQEIDNHTVLSAATALDLHAGSFTNGEFATASGGIVNIAVDTLNNGGYLLSQKEMHIKSDTLTNHAAIAALSPDGDDATLTIEAGILKNHNTIYSGSDMVLAIAERLLNQTDQSEATIYARNDLLIQGNREKTLRTAQVTNDKGLIETAQGDLSIYAGRFDNITDPVKNETVATGTSTITLYPAGGTRFHDFEPIGAFKATGIAGYPLTYLPQAREDVENDIVRSGGIKTYRGEKSLSGGFMIDGVMYDPSEVRSISELPPDPAQSTSPGSIAIQPKPQYEVTYIDKNDVSPEKILAKLNDHYSQYGLSVSYSEPLFTNIGKSSYYIELSPMGMEKERVYTAAFSEDILLSSPAATPRLLSGGEMVVDAQTRNYLGVISARGDIRLEGGIDNRGESLYRYSDVTGEYKYCYKECDSFLHNPDYTWADLDPLKHATLKEALLSAIRSGGHITGEVESLKNDAGVNENADFSTYTPGGSVSGAAADTIARVSEGSLLPSGPYGLFVPVAPDKNMGYLVEANPLYTSREHFIGSDYFLDRMGYEADRMAKRLGDAAYETQMVRDAVMNMTGERFILPDADDDNEQFVRLMDNAVNVSGILGLEVGKPPSPEQLANLSEDIVWMEYQTVNGEEVLAPVVYLAGNTQTLRGTSIAAEQGIALRTSGGTVNSGLIVSGGDIAIESGVITNNSGVVFAGGTASLVAKDDIVNTNGGEISGAQTQIVSTGGSLVNETYAQTFTEGGENHSVAYTLVGKQSTIQAREGNLDVEAAGDIANIGSIMSAARTVALAAGGEVDFSALALESGHTEIWENGFDKASEIGHLRATADAGEHLLISAGADVTLAAARLIAQDTVALDAANITLASLNDIAYKDVQTYSEGSLGSSKTKHDMTYRETVTGSELSGANIVMDSAGDTVLHGGDLKAQENIRIETAGDISIVAAQFREGEMHYSKKKGFGGLSGSTSLDRSDSLNLRAALLKTDAQNIVLNAGKEINVVASDVAAGNILGIKAGNNVHILSGEETASGERYRRKTGISLGIGDDMLSFTEDKRVSDAKETVSQKSSVLSGAAIAVNAGQDITAIGSALAASSIDASAGRDVNLLSATETAVHDYEESTRKMGVGVTLHIDEASVFAGAAAQSDRLDEGNTREAAAQLLGDDITVRAGNNMNVLASNVIADHDAVIETGKNINLLSQDATSYKNEVHEELKAGIKVGVEQHLTGGVRQLADAGKALVDSDNPITAASSVLKSVDLITNTLTHSVSAGFDAFAETSKSTTSAQSASAQNSVIYAGHDVTSDAAKEITVAGSDVAAGNKVSMNAESIMFKSSAQNGSSSSSDKSGSINATLFGTREGQVDASYAQSKNRSNDTVQRDTYVSGKEVAINTSGDTTLRGAHVSSDTVTANVGGNLNLISVQNTGSSKGDHENIALGTAGSGSAGAGKSSGSKAWVNEQTGIIAAEKADITVAGNTDLQGAIIATIDANGNDADNVHLTTGTLSASDIADHDKSTSMSIGLGNITAEQFRSDSRGTTGATLEGGYAHSDKEQINRATIGNGTITLAGGDIVPDTLNRDITKAREITKDESENYDIYASQSSIDRVFDPAKTAAEWKQSAKDMGLSVHKEITENLPGSNAKGLAGAVGVALETAEEYVPFGLLPTQANSGGYITQIATQLFGDNRTGIIVENKETLLKAGVSENDIQKVALVKTKEGIKKAEDLKETDTFLDTLTVYRTDPNKTVIIGDPNDKTGDPALEKYKIRLSAENVKNSGINHLFTNGMFNPINTAAYNQQTQQGNADGILNYNQQHGIIGDLLESAQDALAVNTGLSVLGTGSARQTGEVIDQMATITQGDLTVGAHSQGTLMTQVGMEKNKEHLRELVQGNKESKFLVGYAGSPVNYQISEELVSEIYGGEKAINDRFDNEKGISNVFRSQVNPEDAVGSFLGWQSAGINNSENLGNNVWESFLATPRLFGIGGDSSHSYYPCVIGCGNENYTPDIKNYYTPGATDGAKEHPRTEYYKDNFTNEKGQMTINMDLLSQTNKPEFIQQSTQTILDTTKGQ